MPTQRLFVISEDAAMRATLAERIRAGGHGDALTFDSVLDFIRRYDPAWCGCIVLDLGITAYDGLRLQSQQKKANCRMSILYFVTRDSQPVAVEYVTEDNDLRIFDGPGANQHLLGRIGDNLLWHEGYCANAADKVRLRALYKSTSRREREVMERLVQGRTNKEIGASLGVSPRTVEIYRSRVLQKMQVASVAELVQRWLALEANVSAGGNAHPASAGAANPAT